jgi:flagellar motility protein MotE (MotC chaperone)
MAYNRGAVNMTAVVMLIFMAVAVFDVSIVVFAQQAHLFKVVVGPEPPVPPEPPGIVNVKALLSSIEKEKEAIALQKAAVSADEEKVLKFKEQAEAQKSILDEQQAAITRTLEEITRAMATKDASREQNLALLVKMYSSMKADAVAAVFEKMDEDTVVEILSKMKPAVSAKVLAKMKPSKTSSLSEKMRTQ